MCLKGSHIFYCTTTFILMRKSAFGYWLFSVPVLLPLGLASRVPVQFLHLTKAPVEIKRTKINYALEWFKLGNVTGGVKGNRSQRHRAGANLSQLWRVNLRQFCFSCVVPDGFLSDLVVVLSPSSPALPSQGNPSCVVKNVFFLGLQRFDLAGTTEIIPSCFCSSLL